MPQTPPNNQTKSTQNSLLISEIKDGVVIMSDGSLRAVILASAINFDLMSGQEQDAVEYSFQGFLNSLHFPIQVVIKSQKVDLDSYLAKLDEARGGQTNPLLGELMDDYIANIRGLVEEVNIMDKQFYAVVPYFPPLAVTKSNLASNISNIFKPIPVITVGAAEYDRYKTELGQRVAQVTNGLAQIGVRAIPLNTQELVDLFYNCYNPDVAISQKLIDANQFQTASVTRGNPAPQPTPPAPPAAVAVATPPTPVAPGPAPLISPAPPAVTLPTTPIETPPPVMPSAPAQPAVPPTNPLETPPPTTPQTPPPPGSQPPGGIL